MNQIEESHVRKEDEKAMKIWDCGSPLYDSYELVTLSHLIERHLMAFPNFNGSTNLQSHHHSSAFASSSSLEKSKRGEKASKKPARSSLIGCFAGFMGKNVLKRKVDGGRDETAKKQKKSGISKIFAWTK